MIWASAPSRCRLSDIEFPSRQLSAKSVEQRRLSHLPRTDEQKITPMLREHELKLGLTSKKQVLFRGLNSIACGIKFYLPQLPLTDYRFVQRVFGLLGIFGEQDTFERALIQHDTHHARMRVLEYLSYLCRIWLTGERSNRKANLGCWRSSGLHRETAACGVMVAVVDTMSVAWRGTRIASLGGTENPGFL